MEISNSNPFSKFLDGFGAVTGSLSDFVTIFKDGQVAIGHFTDAMKFLNQELIQNTIEVGKNIAVWVAEKAELIATTIATTAHDLAVKALTVTKQLFNAETWISIGNWIKETAGTVADTVAKGAQAAITGIVTAAQTALNFIMSINPIALVIIAIVALIAAFALLWNKCEGFRNFFIGLWDTFKSIGTYIADKFMSIINQIGDVFKKLFSGDL